MGASRWLGVAAVALAGSVALLLWKGGQQPKTPADADPVILRVGELEVRHSEILALEDYVQTLDPSLGEMTRKRAILDHYVLPLKLSQRDFAKERAKQRKRAEALAKVIGNSASYQDLVTQSQRVPGARLHEGIARRELSLPEARWAFQEENIGRASPILEIPRGYSILATLDKRPGVTTHYDLADVWVAPFHIHADRQAYLEWLNRAKASLSGRLTFIRDDYKEALPQWLSQ